MIGYYRTEYFDVASNTRRKASWWQFGTRIFRFTERTV